jgi:hypothetical protein
MNVNRSAGYPAEIFCDLFPSGTPEKCLGNTPVCIENEDAPFSVSDVNRYVIITKFIVSIFNILPAFIRLWEIQIY